MAALDFRLGAVEIGILLSTVLYGIVTLQAFLYTERNYKDPLWLRIMVGTVWIIETSHVVFIWCLLYSWTITQYGNPEALDGITWSFAMSFTLSAIEGSIVQSFYAYRMRLLSRTWIFPLMAWGGAVARCTLGIFRGVLLLKTNTISNFLANYQWLLTTSMCLNAVVDVLNTSGLCFCLLRNRPALQNTRRVVDRLLLYTVEIGSITSICAVAIALCVNFRPNNNLIYLALFVIYPRLFSNSLFTSLNARQGLRTTGLDTSTRHGRPNSTFVPRQSDVESLSRHIVLELSPRHSVLKSQPARDSSHDQGFGDSSMEVQLDH